MATVFSVFSFATGVQAASFSTDYPNTYTNTGNQCEDIVQVALTQVGYVETGSNITKYNDWMSSAAGYNYQGVSWCAIFVCWCANEAKVPTSIISRNAGCTALYKSFDESQIHHESDGYVPRRGDICFLAGYNSTSPDALAHVGIVHSAEGSNIKIIEGNCGGKVQMLTRPQYGATYSGQYVVAYATPKYTASSLVTGISLSTEELSMKVGDSAVISANVTPSNAENKTLTFTSSDSTVAKVDSNGKVTALKAGTAKITVKSSNGITAVCNVTVGEVKKLSSIKVVTLPTKTNYYLWEAFSSDGLKVVATYTDSTTFDVTSQCTVSGASTSSVGEKTATVRYTEDGVTKTASFNIVVKGKLKTLTVSSMPNKTEYYVGESLDTSGIQVIAGYSDGSVKTVTGACSFTGFSSSSEGTKSVKVSYGEEGITVSAQFSVKISRKTPLLKSISIDKNPNVTEYLQGDAFKSTGIKVTATYSDSSTKDVTKLCTFSGGNCDSVGTKQVTVTYEENSAAAKASFNIIVFAKLKSLSVSAEPEKISYKLNEKFDKSGIKLTASYSDGSTKDVTSLCTFSSLDSSTSGLKEIEASYTERGIRATAKTTVVVLSEDVKLERIGVSVQPTKTEYEVGESFDAAGLKITAVYSDSTRKTITSYCTLSGFDSSKPNEKNVITVTYKDGSNTFTATFTVRINGAEKQKTVTGLEVKSRSLIVRRGASVYNNRLKVVAYFDDSTSQEVTAFVNVNFNSSRIGIKKATVSFTDDTGKTASNSFYVIVIF